LAFVGLSFLFCYPAGLSTTDCILSGDALASYFPYLLRSFRPGSPQVAGPWDPTILTGLPESHSPFGVYYPPTILLYSLFPPAQALSLGLVFHHALAGLGTYFLIRTCRLSRAAAWLAGITFAFGGFMVFHRGHVPIHYSAAWLPWILWGFERFRTTGSSLWVVMTGTLMAFHALGSLMQMIVLGGFAWLTFLAYYGITGPGSRCGRWRFVLGGLAACVLGAIGSLPQTLPMLEVSHWSGYGEFNSDFFNSGYLKVRFLVGLLGPWVLGGNLGVTQPLGYWGLTEHGIFYGVLPFTLALVAILWICLRRARRAGCVNTPVLAKVGSEDSTHPTAQSFLPTRKEAGFWFVLFIESLALMLGKTLPLHYVLSYLPIYQFFHMPTRHVWVMGLALAWLAAFGLDLLRKLDAPIRTRLLTRLGWTLLVLAVIFLALIETQPWPDRPNWTYRGFWLPPVCILLAFGILILIARQKWMSAILMAAVVLTFVDLALNIHNYELSPSSAEFLTARQEFPEAVRWLNERESDPLPARCLIRRDTWPVGENLVQVPAGFGSAWGLSSLNYYTQSMPRSLLRILQLDYYGNADFGGLLAEERGLSAAAGRYILAHGPLNSFAPGLANQVEPREPWTWKTDDRSPGHPSPLTTRGEPVYVSARSDNTTQANTLVASFACDPGQSYLVEGVLPCQQVSGACQRPGPVTCRVVRTRRNSADILGEITTTPSDHHVDGTHFACSFDSGALSGAYWITLISQEGNPLPAPHVTLWHLTSGFAEVARGTDPREMVRKIRSAIRQPYPELARFPGDVCVYANPDARSLAHFVGEVRPARDDVDAARRITAPGPPVRDLAYVIAPNGRSADWLLAGPVRMAGGVAEVRSDRPDDLWINTSSEGEGFMVLAITKCIGWSATIDGSRVPIHAVDGPFMGIRVPPGEHTVHLTFRPVLMWAGTLAAVVFFGGAWLGIIVGAILRLRQAQTVRASRAIKLTRAA
jgi:hypothetical protein